MVELGGMLPPARGMIALRQVDEMARAVAVPGGRAERGSARIRKEL
jgi:hypothetical protein